MWIHTQKEIVKTIKFKIDCNFPSFEIQLFPISTIYVCQENMFKLAVNMLPDMW